jgi:hypothetical protein
MEVGGKSIKAANAISLSLTASSLEPIVLCYFFSSDLEPEDEENHNFFFYPVRS